jgi:hypothetical protein
MSSLRAHHVRLFFLAALTALAIAAADPSSITAQKGGSYNDLVTLFKEWRAFERPPLREGAPDYTAAATAKRHQELKAYQARLAAIDPKGWPVEQQVDWHIVRAEMNGLDFYIRVLKPWVRDPAYYATVWDDQSDTPDHEGPNAHAVVELWTYEYPLSREAEAKLAKELAVIPPLLTQARSNLTGNARDLWMAGTGRVRRQVNLLTGLAERTAGAGADLKKAIAAAKEATSAFATWLEQQAPSKTGPSGIGKADYTWSLQHVHLVPMTWEDEVMLLKRELARAHASLKLEEQRNKGKPDIRPVQSPEEYATRANESASRLLAFLREKDILPVKPNMDPALRAQLGGFVPEATRNFFAIAMHLEPNALYTHYYHWWDLAQMRDEPHPSPIRRGALLYNIWDSRAEGMATGFEEMMMHAGLYDDNPRAREIQWILLAQRAARGLGSLYAQANEFTMKQAADFHVAWTPRGWMSPTLDLLGFEQHLYLRQPGYGTSYVTGKYLIEKMMQDRAKQLGEKFTMRGFFEAVNDAGMIPVSLIRWQITGLDDEIRKLAAGR